MTTNLEYALLSANVYGNSDKVRSAKNTLPYPDGWQPIGTPVVLSDGFMARAYQKGGEIVISYAGTTDENLLDWLTGNVPAATAGYLAPQIFDAAKFYLDIAKANPGISNFSFTGHSLGGGLASLMTVYFDKPAVVFDEAPFQKSADSSKIVDALKIALLASGYTLPTAFTSYIALDPTGAFIPSPTRMQRDDRVSQIYTKGEALSLASTALMNFVSVALGRVNLSLWVLGTGVDKVRGSEQEIDPLAQSILGWSKFPTNGDPVALHSISLLTGFLQNPDFLAVVRAYPELLPRMFAGLYLNLPKSDDANLTDLLVQREYRGEGSLGALAVDVNKINRSVGLTGLNYLPGSGGKGMNNVAAMLMDAVLANLYAQGKDRLPTQTFVGQFDTLLRTTTGGLTADLQALGAEADKVEAELNRMAGLLLGDEAPGGVHAHRARWTLQNGADAMVADLSSDAREDVMIGYINADTMNGGSGDDTLVGLGGDDTLNGGAGVDNLYGGADGDTLDGGAGWDWLYGGAGNDTYKFTGDFGKDTIKDSDGLGSIVLNSNTLTTAKAAGKVNQWKDDNGVVYQFTKKESDTKGSLTITAGSLTDSITINNFDLTKATTGTGYLGIKLDNTPKLAVVKSTGTNVWSDSSFTLASLAGQSTNIVEGTGKTFTLYLNQAAQEGDTITLALGGQGNTFKAILGDRVVDANGAVITLVEGQTQVSVALVQEGELTSDGNAQLSATYSGQAGNATSNVWGLDLKDAGEISKTFNGDQRAKLIGTETQTGVTPDKPSYATYAWGETSWAADGTLNEGLAEADFSDVIYGSTGNDKISGLGGNDALSGGEGNDQIEGGAGDDLIGGGTGSDHILGGDGDDYISSSATLRVRQRSKADDSWSPPAGQQVITQGARWGIYYDGQRGVIWDSANFPEGTDGDVVDAGAGNDRVIASNGEDRVQGGAGDDRIDGLGGNDVLEGNDGKDTIYGDGTSSAGGFTSVDDALHGADFIDGGVGDDKLLGQGGNDDVYGGAGDDKLWGDGSGKKGDFAYLDPSYSGNDYLDGEDGNDYLEGGGKDDILYGGAGNDELWGDTDVGNVATAQANAAVWGNDYLDGEDGDDQLVGGGKDDILYGGAGNDTKEPTTFIPAATFANRPQAFCVARARALQTPVWPGQAHRPLHKNKRLAHPTPWPVSLRMMPVAHGCHFHNG